MTKEEEEERMAAADGAVLESTGVCGAKAVAAERAVRTRRRGLDIMIIKAYIAMKVEPSRLGGTL